MQQYNSADKCLSVIMHKLMLFTKLRSYNTVQYIIYTKNSRTSVNFRLYLTQYSKIFIIKTS